MTQRIRPVLEISGGASAVAPYQASGWPPAAEASGGNSFLGAVIWVPALVIAGVMIYFHLPIAAIFTLGAALLVHSVFLPRIAVYALVAVIPIEWMVSVIPNVTSAAKLIGAYAMLVSVPRIMTAAMPTQWDRSAKWMIMLLVWALLSIVWSPYPEFGLVGWQSLVLIWGIPVLVCVHFRDEQCIHLLMKVYVASCLINAAALMVSGDLLGIVEGGQRQELSSFVGQAATETTGSVNTLARHFAICVFICFYLLIVERKTWQRMVLPVVIACFSVGIVVLKGRAVYVGLPAALVGAVILLGGAGVLKRVLLIGLISIIGGLGAVVVIKLGFFGEGIVERFDSIFKEGFEAGSRGLFWKQHIQAMVNTAFIGRGINQLQFLPEASYHVAHNDLISIAGQLGLIGVVSFLAFHASLVMRMRKIPHLWTKMFCLMTWCFMIFAGLTEDDFPLKYYTLAVAWILCLVHLYEHRRIA